MSREIVKGRGTSICIVWYIKAVHRTCAQVGLDRSIRGINEKTVRNCVRHISSCIPADAERKGAEQCAVEIGANDPLPGVQGHMDHISVDVKGKRLFVPANGDTQNTVEAIDLMSGKRIFSIPGQSKP